MENSSENIIEEVNTEEVKNEPTVGTLIFDCGKIVEVVSQEEVVNTQTEGPIEIQKEENASEEKTEEAIKKALQDYYDNK